MVQTEDMENIKTHILCSVTVLRNRAVYEMWENVAQPDRQ
jgi:hypothetical protein